MIVFMVGLSALLATPAGAADTVATSANIVPAMGGIQPNPLLSIDQNRARVVDHVIHAWGDALAGAGAGLSKEQLRALLAGLRSDQLLAASLAGSLEGLRNVIANALTANAPVAKGLIQTKALGDAADDLVYTPVVPCRLADTRSAGGPIAAFATRDFKVWVSSGGFTAQGGDAGNCAIPADPAAVVLNLTVVNPGGLGNLIAYPTGAAVPNTSTLNYQNGTVVLANGAVIPACRPGCANQITMKANGPATDLVIDVVGYFRSPGGGNIAISGNLTLVESTATAGNILKGSTRFIHNFGSANIFIGENAGNFTMTGSENTATGNNTLNMNTSGNSNTADGYRALANNKTGTSNTASGADALGSNAFGSYNTATGVAALFNNINGTDNMANGYGALYSNTHGNFNIANGTGSLFANDIGVNNTAIGYFTLNNNTFGSFNTAIGSGAGENLTTGSYNIMIGNAGIAGEGSTTRIGDVNQTRTFVAGIYGVTTVGAAIPVVVASSGQLGTVSSSRRYKDDIADMGDATKAFMKLRPVTFHYKSDRNPKGRMLQYGLIAEEVAEVYPDLVARSADGRIETVMYQFLPPMLLNEYQKQQRTIEAQAREIARQATRLAELERNRDEQLARMDAMEQQLARIAQGQEQAEWRKVAGGK